jgi:hypothetical protein
MILLTTTEAIIDYSSAKVIENAALVFYQRFSGV